MIENKYDFIQGLLSNEKLNPRQKEKLLRLTIDEIKKESSKDSDILKRISNIEDLLAKELMKGPKGYSDQNTLDQGNDSLPKYVNPEYVNPANLSSFLTAYNQHPVLKYTCHEIDDNEVVEDIIEKCSGSQYDFVEHQKLINKSFQELTKKHWIHPNVYSRINTYLNGGGSTWGAERIETSWNSQEIIEWAQLNPGMVPNPGDSLKNRTKNRGYRLPKAFSSHYTGERVTDFSRLTTYFKHLFHIRGDNTLKRIIERVNQKNNWDDRIIFELNHEDFWENLELFTDVDKLVQAYEDIINMILQVVNKHSLDKPQIQLSFKETDDIITFSIHHLNTVFKKTPENVKNRLGDSMSRLIASKINGLADLYLKADFDHGKYAELNLWNGNQIKINLIEKFNGAEFRLEFKDKKRVTISKEMIEQFQKSFGL